MLTYLQWLGITSDYYVKHKKEFREGQAYFNSLSDHQPKLACQLGGTSLDPFYRDEVLPDFLDEVEDQWGRYDTVAVRQPELVDQGD